MANGGAVIKALIGACSLILRTVDLMPRVHATNGVFAQVDDDCRDRPGWQRPCGGAFAQRAVAVLYRLELSLDVEIAGTIDSTGWLERILDGGNGYVRCRR